MGSTIVAPVVFVAPRVVFSEPMNQGQRVCMGKWCPRLFPCILFAFCVPLTMHYLSASSDCHMTTWTVTVAAYRTLQPKALNQIVISRSSHA